MRPRFELVGSILRANVRAFAALGAPVAAVLKNDAYGWGVARVAREIDETVESYIVNDEDEFWALRMHTRRPIRLLASVAPRDIARVCAQGGIPNVTTPQAVDAAVAYAALAQNPVTIRLGVVDAAGWAGIAIAELPAFAALCAGRNVRLELWTHMTSAARAAQCVRAFEAAVAAVRAAGVDVASTDIASTAWASFAPACSRVRIGAGLFGARLGATVATSCAIRVDAPVVRWFAPGTIAWAGYGEHAVPPKRGVAVLRCGYGDGFPKKLAGDDDILSVGMQYTSRLADNPTREHALIDAASELDLLAVRLDLGPHELITGLAQHI